MGITKGKGFAGALGSMRDMQHEYVPLPYKEMMAGNLMRQQSYDKSQATLDGLDALYDESFIEKDSAILGQQEQELDASISEMIEGAGGDLGKLAGAFTNLYRKTASNKTLKNATAQKANRDAFAKELQGAKLDSGMAQFYLNQADEQYQGADKGKYNGVGYSTVSQEDIRAKMTSMAGHVPVSKGVEVLNGYMYEDRFYTDETLLANGIDGKALGLTKAARNDKTTTRSPAKIQGLLELSVLANNEWGRSINDYAEAHGMDPEKYTNSITASASLFRGQNDYEEGRVYEPVGGKFIEGSEEKGLDLKAPGSTLIVDSAYLLLGDGDDGQPLETLTFAEKIFNLDNAKARGIVGDSEYYAEKSILAEAKRIAEETLGYPITAEDMESVKTKVDYNSHKVSDQLGKTNYAGREGTAKNIQYTRVKDIHEALEGAMNEVTSRSTFAPDYIITSNMKKGQEEVLSEFKTAMEAMPAAFMQVKGVDMMKGEGYTDPDKAAVMGALPGLEITGISDRPIMNHATGQLEYRITGTYLAEREDRAIDEKKDVRANFNGVVPVSTTQQQVWSRLGLSPLTATKADLANLTITGQTTTTDKLMDISAHKSMLSGSDIMSQPLGQSDKGNSRTAVTYGALLHKTDDGKAAYSLVEIDAKTGTPIKGEDEDLIYFNTSKGPATFSTLDVLSRYIDKAHKEIIQTK